MNKRFKQKQYNSSVREFVDSDYKENVPLDDDGKAVTSLKLSEENKQWMYDFENEYYGNNHRKGKIHKNHPDYETRMKKEMDDATNDRNFDILSLNRYDKRMIRDLTNVANPEYQNEELMGKLVLHGFEETVKMIIKDTLIDLGVEDNALHQGMQKVGSLCIDVVRVIKQEQASRRSSGRRDGYTK